jgi:hypothetical protein
MKYLDLVPGDPVGGQMYQFNARINREPSFLYLFSSIVQNMYEIK